MARKPRRVPRQGGGMPRGAGVPDLQSLVHQAAEMQAEMQRRQAELAEQTFTGTSGGGAVRAELEGTGRLVSVAIDPGVLDPEDAELVGDLVVAAVNDAHRAMTEAAGEALDPNSLGIPGLPGGEGGLPDADTLRDLLR